MSPSGGEGQFSIRLRGDARECPCFTRLQIKISLKSVAKNFSHLSQVEIKTAKRLCGKAYKAFMSFMLGKKKMTATCEGKSCFFPG